MKKPTKKEILENLLHNAEIKLINDEFMEKYFQVKWTFEPAKYAQSLGMTQASIKENKSIIKFFNEELEDLSKNK